MKKKRMRIAIHLYADDLQVYFYCEARWGNSVLVYK